jgi:hypothetical protein
MQRIQAIPERVIGIRIEVAVAVQSEADRGMSSQGGDLLRIRPAAIQSATAVCLRSWMRSPSSPATLVAGRQIRCRKVANRKRPTLRTHKHQIVGGPGTGQQVGQGLDHEPGEPDTPIASSGLGRPEMQITADPRDDLHDKDDPGVGQQAPRR